MTKAETLEIGSKICKGIRALEIENEKSDEGKLVISVGIAFVKVDKVVLKSDLMKGADDALYQAKKSGKNQVF